PAGRYLVNPDDGMAIYRTDVPIDRKRDRMDSSHSTKEGFSTGVKMEVPADAERERPGPPADDNKSYRVVDAPEGKYEGVPVGMYLGLDNATPIFVGGLLRYATDRLRGGQLSEAETETSPGVLLSSGYIAGGTLCGLLIAFVSITGATKVFDLSTYLGEGY